MPRGRALVERLVVPVIDRVIEERLVVIQWARRYRLLNDGVEASGAPFVEGTRREGQPTSLIDGVDALGTCMRLAADLPQAQVLVEDAHALLGHVLRDADLLVDLLAAHPHAEPADRRALLVACSLLGVLPDLALAVPNPADALDTQARVLAAVLAHLDAAERQIAAADRRARGTARDVTDQTRLQLAVGLPITVVG